MHGVGKRPSVWLMRDSRVLHTIRKFDCDWPRAGHVLVLAAVFALVPTFGSWIAARYGILCSMVTGAVNLLLFALLLRQIRRLRQLEYWSIRDSLTGLFNRHFMEIALDRELRRAARQGTSLAVFMIDVDHFKTLNDNYGHEAGDIVLREMAAVFTGAIRREDIVCRYGGEEFLVILPDIQPGVARHRAECICRAVSKTKLRLGLQTLPQVTVSIGMAIYLESGETPAELLRVADRDLYTAKRLGRNRVHEGKHIASTSSIPARSDEDAASSPANEPLLVSQGQLR